MLFRSEVMGEHCMLPQYQPVQLAYFVQDVRSASSAFSSATGAGPFYVIENIELAWCVHRDIPGDFVHTSAYGQWGTVMVEFVQQEDSTPSPFMDMYSTGSSGVHHVASFVNSIDQAVSAYSELGFPTATRALAKLGAEFAFIDTTQLLGHMLEVYVATQNVRHFYDMVKDVSVGWDGADPVRTL